MKPARTERFESVLKTFPDSAGDLLRHLPQQGGKLSAKTCAKLMRLLDVSVEELAMRLLPLATVFSVAPLSNFNVGAVALSGESPVDGGKSLYLGANMEFEHLALNMSIHAEQAVVVNAWHHGAGLVKSIASSEPPCGHCRQFLKELHDGFDLMLLQPGREGKNDHSCRLSEMLPGAFSPADLGHSGGFMAAPATIRHLRLDRTMDDPVVQSALAAAASAYAPYSGNFAGCALQTPEGEIVNGRYVESVAHNPSISPLHSTLLRWNLMSLEETRAIHRMVLVEKPTRIRQKDLVGMLFGAWAQGVELEYYIAQEEESP
jgi:cytidine deaminase